MRAVPDSHGVSRGREAVPIALPYRCQRQGHDQGRREGTPLAVDNTRRKAETPENPTSPRNGACVPEGQLVCSLHADWGMKSNSPGLSHSHESDLADFFPVTLGGGVHNVLVDHEARTRSRGGTRSSRRYAK